MCVCVEQQLLEEQSEEWNEEQCEEQEQRVSECGVGQGGQWLLVGDKNRIGRRHEAWGMWHEAASQTFASEYVKCFGKCVPNVVDERSGRGARGGGTANDLHAAA